MKYSIPLNMKYPCKNYTVMEYQALLMIGWKVTSSVVRSMFPDGKVHGANMGPTWVLSAPDGSHDGSIDLALRVGFNKAESKPMNITCHAPQDAILDPFLLTLYINDMPVIPNTLFPLLFAEETKVLMSKEQCWWLDMIY